MKKIRLIEMVISIAIFMLTLTCRAGITVSYKGLNKVHLEYDSGYVNGPATIQLIDGDRVIETRNVKEGETGKISGKICDTGLAEGIHTYQILINSDVSAEAKANINGKIDGTLLFDESINETTIIEYTVSIPVGKTLDVNGNLAEGFIWVRGTMNLANSTLNCDVRDYGTINFGGGVVLGGYFYFYVPIDINGVYGDAHLFFHSNSSTIQNCRGSLQVYLYKNSSLSIDNSEICTFGMDRETSLNITNSTISSVVALPEVDNLIVDGSTFLNAVFIAGGSPKFKDCEFASDVILHHRTLSEFTNCVFGYSLTFDDAIYDNDIFNCIFFDTTPNIDSVPKWSQESEITPVLSGNNFVGASGPHFVYPEAPFAPVALGNNCYGAPRPVFDYAAGRFLTREIFINKIYFQVNSWNSSGPEMKNQKRIAQYLVKRLCNWSKFPTSFFIVGTEK
ncbi:MAG TPA: hypothetical protein P5025_05700 [Candidatus Ratteibacteria bacterium]|nr:hypothetical protein [Candidatus Ratteibacteria bacterium]